MRSHAALTWHPFARRYVYTTLKIIPLLFFSLYMMISPVLAESLCDESAENSFGYLELFSVGDIVAPYSHYDPEKDRQVIGSPENGMENTKWKIVEISDIEIQIELIEGEFTPWYEEGVTHKAGEYRAHYETKKEHLRLNLRADKSKPENMSVFKCVK